jgi:hypothetical protein
MAKTFLITADSQPILEAMWKELKQMGYTTTKGTCSLDANEWYQKGIISNCSSENQQIREEFIELVALTDFETDITFKLPQQYNKALAFAKEQIESFDKVTEYYECIHASSNFTIGKIYKCLDPHNINTCGNFIDNSGDRNGFSILNSEYFKPSTKEAYDLQNKPKHPLANCVKGKIYWSNNSVYPLGHLWRYKDHNTGFMNVSSVIGDNLSNFEVNIGLNDAHWGNLREATLEEIKWLEACEKADKFISKEEALNPKPKFKVGDWVYHTLNREAYKITSIKGDCFNAEFGFGCDSGHLDLRLCEIATQEQIKAALIEEAKRRYPVGTRFISSLNHQAKREVTSNDYYWWQASDIVVNKQNGPSVYTNGKWAEIIKEKVINFGKIEFTCYKGYAECSHGKVTKSEIKEILDFFDKDISILGYKMSIVNEGNWFVKFGCQQDKLSKIREIYNNI